MQLCRLSLLGSSLFVLTKLDISLKDNIAKIIFCFTDIDLYSRFRADTKADETFLLST